MEALQRQQAARLAQGVGPLAPPRLPLPQPPLLGARTLQAPEGALGVVGVEEEEDAEDEEGETPLAEEETAEQSHPGAQCPNSPSSQSPGIQPHEWTYEEQFKQVGTLSPSLPGCPSYLPLAKLVYTSLPPSAECKNRDLERDRKTERWIVMSQQRHPDM